MGFIKSGLFISLDGVIEAPETWHFPTSTTRWEPPSAS